MNTPIGMYFLKFESQDNNVGDTSKLYQNLGPPHCNKKDSTLEFETVNLHVDNGAEILENLFRHQSKCDIDYRVENSITHETTYHEKFYGAQLIDNVLNECVIFKYENSEKII